MSHVAPHRLAALAAGKLTGRAAARARRHLDDCAACRGAWQRVRGARATFPEIAALPAPELHWDRIRAQTYWSLGASASASQPALPAQAGASIQAGSSSHAGRPVAGASRAWRWPRLVPAGVLGLAAAGAVVTWQLQRDERAPLPAAPAAFARGGALGSSDGGLAPAAPSPLVGVVTLVEAGGTVVTADGRSIVGGNAVGAHGLGAGDRVATAGGRLSAQFGAGSTITVGPHSSLVLARFDHGAIELALGDAGRVDVEVSHRAPEQRFTVRAGDRLIEVRGTAFRVERTAARVAVACEHGRVAVSSAGGAPAAAGAVGADGATAVVELGAGQALDLADHEPLLGRAARPMSDGELAALFAARPAPLPQWTDPETIYRTTTGLALAAPADHTIAVDGVAIGRGPLWRRVPPGRHLVESTDGAGRVHAGGAGGWIEVDAASPDRPIVLAAAEPDSSGGAEPALATTGSGAARARRLTELRRAIDQAQLRNCVRALAKQGLAEGTHVELEIGVQASGDIRYLNIVHTDLPDRTAACVRDVVGAARLGDGAQVSWRHRISF